MTTAIKDTPLSILLIPASVIGCLMVLSAALMLGISVLDSFPGWTTLTFEHYREFFDNRFLLQAGLRTISLAAVVTLVCLLFGYPVAWFLVLGRSRIAHLVFLAVLTPLIVSIVVRMFGWTILLGNEGLLNKLMVGLGIVAAPVQMMRSFWTVAVGLVHIFLPFMILSLTSTLGRIDPSLAEAAATLGSRPVRSFFQIILPLSAQGIATGSIIVFCLATGVYLTPFWLGRGNVTVLATAIQQQILETGDWPTGAASAMLLTFFTLLLVAGYSVLIRRLWRR
ncbi:ABC transporter permease [Bradyrhizobium yuanmingense]|uniref:ABC transporter permease n=1 Tax=Bradyrhizobium yuanmingense TaxID=108015 RepID=UPI0023B9D5FB|nr:ABC transporter permease [Bradyrhizobium yuanmingense]MDF0520128.1 ABC transporter permease [Bradyrhizobium yuanmingense]